jgi:hypothetical protein
MKFEMLFVLCGFIGCGASETHFGSQ